MLPLNLVFVRIMTFESLVPSPFRIQFILKSNERTTKQQQTLHMYTRLIVLRQITFGCDETQFSMNTPIVTRATATSAG